MQRLLRLTPNVLSQVANYSIETCHGDCINQQAID